MNTDRIKKLAKEQGKTVTYICSLLGRPKYYLNDIAKSEGDMPAEYLDILAKELHTTPEYLLEKTDNPLPHSEQVKEYLSYERRGKRPIIGIASAGTGVIANEDIIGWQSVDDGYDTEDYFWLKVAGDSMSPKIDDGDLVLIDRLVEVEHGNIVVAIVDNTEGFVKQVEIYSDEIVLHSFNPYYPDMTFVGKERNRLRFIGRARKVERDL